jgi:hypothetical protein
MATASATPVTTRMGRTGRERSLAPATASGALAAPSSDREAG